MSLNNKLRFIAKTLCRELRKNATHSEKIMWEVVRNRKLNGRKINRQFPIFYDLEGMEKFYIADFYCHQKKLVIEVDGGYHERQKNYDELRTEIVNLLGIKVIRFTNKEVENNLANVKNSILKCLQ
ncbi:MAG: endonuclease domain-containing protein [Melioribacteraceae bacterium]|nr:endonuclease domain-containing protein [Melioribacteraceae bacterium]